MIFAHHKASNEIVFIFLVNSRPLRTRWRIFQKNPSQKFLTESIESPLGIAYTVEGILSTVYLYGKPEGEPGLEIFLFLTEIKVNSVQADSVSIITIW